MSLGSFACIFPGSVHHFRSAGEEYFSSEKKNKRKLFLKAIIYLPGHTVESFVSPLVAMVFFLSFLSSGKGKKERKGGRGRPITLAEATMLPVSAAGRTPGPASTLPEFYVCTVAMAA